MFGFLKKDEAAGAEKKPSWTERLKAGLAKTRAQLGGQLSGLFRRAKIDDELLEDLESTLLMADCGVEATQWLLAELKSRVKQHRLETPDQLRQALIELLDSLPAKPFEVLAVHDCFRCLPNYGNDLRRQYTLQLQLIAKSKLLQSILSQILGRNVTIGKLDDSLWYDIGLAEYALS